MLSAAGIDIYNPGTIISLGDEHLKALAHLLRQDEELLRSRIGAKDGKSLLFGDLVFPVGTLETRLRRIGPRSLRTEPHHRFAWLNRLLPCCPVSGEHLVDVCGECGQPLRWYRTWGIGVCESCRSQVAPSHLPPLSADDLRPYRVIADLMDRREEVRDDRLRRLPVSTHGHPTGTLALTAIQLASLLKGSHGLGGEIYHILRLDPEDRAQVVCDAGRLLSKWPHALREAFREKVDGLGTDHDQFFRLWRAFKRFATASLSGKQKARLVLEGLPDLASSIWHSFSSSGDIYSTQDAMRVLGIDNQRTKRLATVDSLVHMQKPSRHRGNRQFRADAIDGLRRTKDASTTFASITEETGIPNYGVEQLAASGLLEFRAGDAMRIAYPRPFVSTCSYRDVVAACRSSARSSPLPKDARRLSDCCRLLGGGEKPWHLIVEALATGPLAHWNRSRNFDIRSILVRAEDLRQFLGKRFDPASHEFEYGTTYTKRETAEVLTIDSPQLDAHLEGLGLAFQQVGRAREIHRGAVLDVARQIISNAELGEHLGLAPKSVRYDKRMSSIARKAYGWSRDDVIAAGLIPDWR